MAESPSITDIIQAIAAAVAIPGAIVAFIVLFRRDKEREKEIESLTAIAAQLTKLIAVSESRYQDVRKPIIEFKSVKSRVADEITIVLTNLNSQSKLKKVECSVKHKAITVEPFKVIEEGNLQRVYVILESSEDWDWIYPCTFTYTLSDDSKLYQNCILANYTTGTEISAHPITNEEVSLSGNQP